MPISLNRDTGVVSIFITLNEVEALPCLQENSRHRNTINQISKGHSRPTAFASCNYFADPLNANPSVGVELLGNAEFKYYTGVMTSIFNTVAISQDVDAANRIKDDFYC